MNYRPGDARDPYMARAGYGYRREDHPDHDRPYHDGFHTVITVIRLLTGIAVTVFALRVLFVALDANQTNDFVSFDHVLAKTLVLGLGAPFTPRDVVLSVVLNYGLAALIYVVIALLVIKALRHR